MKIKETLKKYHDIEHRLTVRMPEWMLNGIDKKRRERSGNVSRTLWIVEIISKELEK